MAKRMLHSLLHAGPALFLLGQAVAAHGAELIDSGSYREVVGVVRGFGSAFLTRGDDGREHGFARFDGTSYAIYFMDCNADDTRCETLLFQAMWDGIDGLSLAHVNRWNMERSYGKAYLDPEGQPVLEVSVNLEGGITLQNLDDTVSVWCGMLSSFPAYLGNAVAGEDIMWQPAPVPEEAPLPIHAAPAAPLPAKPL